MTGMDPLSNPLILEHIFKYLLGDAPNLRSVRLVSSLWEKASLDPWRKTVVLVVYPDGGGGGRGRVSLSSTSSAGSDHLTLSKFNKKMMMSKSKKGDLGRRKPFHRYKLVGWRFHPEHSKSELRFFREHGPSIKYLHLDRCTFSSFSDLEELLSRMLPNLDEKLVLSVTTPRADFEDYDANEHPGEMMRDENNGYPVDANFVHLKARHDSRLNFQRSCKVLEMRCSSSIVVPADSWAREHWTKLFYCMSAVEDVTLQMNAGERRYYGATMYGLIDGLRLATRLHGGSNIRKLDIMDFFLNANHWFGGSEFLVKYRTIFDSLLLQELSMDWGSESDEIRSKNVLKSVSHTLQVLKAFRAPRKLLGGRLSPSPQLSLLPGTMNALRELHLYGNVTENLTFLRFTPGLQVLVMNQFCFAQRHKVDEVVEQANLRFCKDDLVSNTKSVLHHRSNGIAESEVTVPSLEHLELDYPVGAEGVPALARWLPNVKTLKMVMDNELLSESCKGWPKLEEIECLFRSEVDDGGVSSLVQCPELRKFKMNAVCGQATLTSSSMGQFLKIGSLRELDICISDQVNAQEEAQLEDKLRAVKLNRSDHGSDDNLELECCQWKRFLLKIGVVVKVKKKLPPKNARESDSPGIGPRALRSGRIVQSGSLRSGRNVRSRPK